MHNKRAKRQVRSKPRKALSPAVNTAIQPVATATPSPPTSKACQAEQSTGAGSAQLTAEPSRPGPADTSETLRAPTGLPSWQSLHEAVVGLSHRNASPPLPCQDAALARSLPRPTLLIADGAGSSAVSEIGAQAVITAVARLLHTLDRQLASLLDDPLSAAHSADHAQQARHFALLLVKHARGVLEDLAAQQRRPQRDFRCTLLLMVLGETSALWLKLGDGALVYERVSAEADGEMRTVLCTLGEPGKGEFANTTQFIDEQLSPDDVQSGLLPLAGITGLAAMSDGAAEKLIAQNGSQVARQLQHWLQALRRGQLPRRDLTRSFYSEAFCHASSGDDCSIALLAREQSAPSKPSCEQSH